MNARPPRSTTAAGQLLGYSLQFPRALCRLMQVGPKGAVGIEVIGDVDAYLGDGTVVSEEDKSGIVANPLTNRSTDLWKTIHNWIKAVNEGSLDLASTNFVLYCNQQGRRALVNDLDEASSVDAAKAAIAKVKEELGDISTDHAIWLYYDYAVNQHVSILEKLIPRFSLIIGSDTAHSDVQHEIERLMLPEAAQELVMNELGGWFQRTVMQLIKSGEPGVVRFSDLKKHMSVLFTQIRQRELVDFAAKELALNEKTGSPLTSRPVFVQQLDFIALPDDRKLEAVADYMRADYNRNRWIENEFLDEQTASDFEGKLQTFWETAQRKYELLHSNLAEEVRGELLLGDCTARQETIRGVSPPDRTVAGTYHALADRKTLGWHPRWYSLLHEEEGSVDG